MNSTKALRALASTVVTAALLHGAPAVAEVVGSEAWTRATAPGIDTAVGYLVLTNKGDEQAKLLRIVSPVCDKIMIHRSTVDSNGVARMWPVAKLEIAPSESVRFEPNGLHIMFMELKQPFVVGQKVPLQLTFEGEKEFTVTLEVKPLVPDAGVDRSTMHRDHGGTK